MSSPNFTKIIINNYLSDAIYSTAEDLYDEKNKNSDVKILSVFDSQKEILNNPNSEKLKQTSTIYKNEISKVIDIIKKEKLKNLKFLSKLDDELKYISIFQYLILVISEKVDKIYNITLNKNIINDFVSSKTLLTNSKLVHGDFLEELLKILKNLEREIKNIGEVEKDEVISTKEEIVEFWKTIINRGDILSAPMILLFDNYIYSFDIMKKETFEIPIKVKSLRNLIKNSLISSKSFLKDIVVQLEAQTDIDEIPLTKGTKETEFVKEVVKFHKKMKILLNLMSTLPNIDYNNTASIIDSSQSILNFISTFKKIYNEINNFSFENKFAAIFLNNFINHIKQKHESTKIIENKYSLKNFKHENTSIKDFNNIIVLKNLENVEWTFHEFDFYNDTVQNFFQTYQYLYALLRDTLFNITNPALDALLNWKSSNKNWRNLCKTIDGEKVKEEVNQPINEISIEELVKKIDPNYGKPNTLNETFTSKKTESTGYSSEEKSSHENSCETSPGLFQPNSQIQFQENSPSQNSDDSFSSPTNPTTTIEFSTWEDDMLRKISKQLDSKNLPFSTKASLVHSLMFLIDRNIIENRWRQVNELDPYYLFIQSIDKTYFLLEHSIKSQCKIENADIQLETQHDLRLLYSQFRPNDTSRIKIIHVLSGGYLWASFPHQQDISWYLYNRNGTPPVLRQIINLYKDTDANTNKIQNTMKLIAESTKEFVETTFLKNNNQQDSVRWKSVLLTPDENELIAITKLNLLNETCLKFEKQASEKYGSKHLITENFGQILKDIRCLTWVMKQLNGSIQSDELSLLVRSCLLWQQRIMQQLIQNVNIMKDSTLTHAPIQNLLRIMQDHNLCKLFNDIKWTTKPTKEQIGVIDLYFNINHYVHYPFEGFESQEMPKMLELILQATMIRENLDFVKGFDVNAKTIKTKFNFIPISSDISYSKILKKVTTFYDQSMDVIDKILLTELKTLLS